MPDQHGFGDNGTESTRPRQSGQGDDQMNEYDNEVAHSGNGINTSQTTALWQFAIDTLMATIVRANAQAVAPLAPEERVLALRSDGRGSFPPLSESPPTP